MGSGSVPETLKAASAGPEALTRSDSLPVALLGPTANPAIRMLAPVPTPARHERLIRRPGSEELTTPSVAALLVALPLELVATQV